MRNVIVKKLTNRRPGIMGEDDFFISAVLLPLIEKQSNLHVLFEVRATNLKIQPGEICFPGGRVENSERGKAQDAAVRETMEELGIKREDIQIIGPLDILPTPQGRLVYPYVGEILTSKLNPNPEEVTEVFTVPVEYFLNNPPCISHSDIATQYCSEFPFHKIPPEYRQEWQKRWSVPIYYFEYDKYFIWGMTAKILYHFLQLCWPKNIYP